MKASALLDEAISLRWKIAHSAALRKMTFDFHPEAEAESGESVAFHEDHAED